MTLFMPGMGGIDLERGTIGVFREGGRPVEVTSVEDTARRTARVALDRSVAPGQFAFAGDRLSFRLVGAIVTARAGRAINPVSHGSDRTCAPPWLRPTAAGA